MHKEIKGSNIVDVRLVLRAGQAYDHKVGVPAGTAHFLEHIVHEKTEKYATKEELVNIVAIKGGQRNASTSPNEKMQFYATVLKDESDSAADFVSQLVSHAVLTEEATIKHRSIIEQEYLSKIQDPSTKSWIGFQELAYGGSGIEYIPTGDLDSISKITREDMQNFYDTRFKAENAVLSIYGDISFENALELAKKYFLSMKTDIPFSENNKFELEKYSITLDRINNTEKLFKHTEIKEDQAVVYFGGMNLGRFAPNYYHLKVLLHALAADFTSILYKILREEKHLVYHMSFAQSSVDSVGTHAFTLNIAPENIQKSIDIILAEINKIADGNIDEKRLSVLKSRIRAREVFGLQSVQSQAENDSIYKLLFLNIKDSDEYLAKIDAVTKEKVIEAAKYLKDHMNLLSVCSNKKEEYAF